MKLSEKSKKLMLFFTKNKHIHKIKQNNKTKNILKELYDNIFEAYSYLNTLKKKGKYYSFSIKSLQNATQIIQPLIFNSNSFPELVRNHIAELSMTELIYTFSLYGRNIKLYFIIEEDDSDVKLEKYSKYVDAIIMWLYILNQYSSKNCSNSLIVYFYFTSLEKHIPSSNIFILDEINVNTAFTTSCSKNAEIVVFRKEEWFKVFIHETFHNFGLDFSDMNNDIVHKCILDIFKVTSDVNLFESYTEFWAEIINALFCSFFSIKEKTNFNDFLSYSEFFINFERTYSFFQLVKTLNFMDLDYKDLYSNNIHSKILRENLYKEKTNVLSYYIIKSILINNYQDFLYWCKNENVSLLQFRKTYSNQKKYCNFIQKNFKIKSMLEKIDETKNFIYKLERTNKKNNYNYILSNLRMSICELG
jgi:hypothetical protein